MTQQLGELAALLEDLDWTYDGQRCLQIMSNKYPLMGIYLSHLVDNHCLG